MFVTTDKDHPIRNWTEHQREVFSVDWNNIQKELFMSCSWDGNVKIVRVYTDQWHPERPASIQTLPPHGACVYKAAWSPHDPTVLATACGDGNMRLFDTRIPAARPVATMGVGGEVLSLDWNKYRRMTLASGSSDRTVKTWDIRAQPAPAQSVLTGHTYAVRCVTWSAHQSNILATAGYDMTARIWNVDDAMPQGMTSVLSAPRFVYTGHTEFVIGLAWSLFEPGMIASTSWDMSTHLWPALP